jgi:hypothetical protein
MPNLKHPHPLIVIIAGLFVAAIMFIAMGIFTRTTDPDVLRQTEPINPDPVSQSSACATQTGQALQSCCDAWFEQSDLMKIECIGSWELSEDGQCSWQCTTAE